MTALESFGPCPNCGDASEAACPRCQLFGAHGGSCLHGQPLGVTFTPVERDPLWPNGGRPFCRNGDGRRVYRVGLCGECWAGS